MWLLMSVCLAEPPTGSSIGGGEIPEWEEVGGVAHLALASSAEREVWVEVQLSYGQWRTRWVEGPFPPGTSVLAAFRPPPDVDYPTGMFEQPSLVVANVRVDGRGAVSSSLPVVLERGPSGRVSARALERRADPVARAASGRWSRAPSRSYRPVHRMMVVDEHNVTVTPGVLPVVPGAHDSMEPVEPVRDDALVLETAPDGWHRREVRP